MKIIEGKRRLRVRGVSVRFRFLLFYYELAQLTRDITCSKLYFEGKRYEEAMSDEHRQKTFQKTFQKTAT